MKIGQPIQVGKLQAICDSREILASTSGRDGTKHQWLTFSVVLGASEPQVPAHLTKAPEGQFAPHKGRHAAGWTGDDTPSSRVAVVIGSWQGIRDVIALHQHDGSEVWGAAIKRRALSRIVELPPTGASGVSCGSMAMTGRLERPARQELVAGS